MEYIYSDESVSKGEYFSDFFGGALVTNTNFNEVNSALEVSGGRVQTEEGLRGI